MMGQQGDCYEVIERFGRWPDVGGPLGQQGEQVEWQQLKLIFRFFCRQKDMLGLCLLGYRRCRE